MSVAIILKSLLLPHEAMTVLFGTAYTPEIFQIWKTTRLARQAFVNATKLFPCSKSSYLEIENYDEIT